MKTISRNQLTQQNHLEIINKENHHNHEIIEHNGIYRWKVDPTIDYLVHQMDFNELIMNLYKNGHDKNSEMFRKIYRDIGYSLDGYWEIFYCQVNNEKANEYRI